MEGEAQEEEEEIGLLTEGELEKMVKRREEEEEEEEIGDTCLQGYDHREWGDDQHKGDSQGSHRDGDRNR